MHIACKHEAGGNHVCEQCGKVFHHKSRLNSHIFKAHRPTSSTPCNICGRLFNSRAMAISHNRTVHMGARPFKVSYIFQLCCSVQVLLIRVLPDFTCLCCINNLSTILVPTLRLCCVSQIKSVYSLRAALRPRTKGDQG